MNVVKSIILTVPTCIRTPTLLLDGIDKNKNNFIELLNFINANIVCANINLNSIMYDLVAYFNIDKNDVDEILLTNSYKLNIYVLLYFQVTKNLFYVLCKLKDNVKNILDIAHDANLPIQIDELKNLLDSLNNIDDKCMVLKYYLNSCLRNNRFLNGNEDYFEVRYIVLKYYNEHIISLDDNVFVKYFAIVFLLRQDKQYIDMINNMNPEDRLKILIYISNKNMGISSCVIDSEN